MVIKTLIITKFLDNSPGGIVSQRLLEMLSELPAFSVRLIAQKISVKPKFGNTRLYEIPFYLKINFLNKYHSRIELIFRRLGLGSLLVFFNNIGFYFIAKKHITKHDVCLLLIGSNSEHLINLTKINKTKTKIWVHSVDPIPRSLNWEKYDFNSKFLSSLVKSNLQRINILTFGNKKMLNFSSESNLFQNFPELGTAVFRDPLFANKLRINVKKHNNKKPLKLLYLGSMYNQRKPDLLFQAIEDLFINYPVELHIYGSLVYNYKLPEYVYIHSAVDNVFSIYAEYDVLLDLSANSPEDVFISYKLKTYLTMDRPILALCSHYSATHSFIMGLGDKNIFTSDYDLNDIKSQIMQLINHKFEYDNREQVLKKYKEDNELELSYILNYLGN